MRNHEMFENYFIYFDFLFIFNHAIVYGYWSSIIPRNQHGKDTGISRFSQKLSNAWSGVQTLDRIEPTYNVRID